MVSLLSHSQPEQWNNAAMGQWSNGAMLSWSGQGVGPRATLDRRGVGRGWGRGGPGAAGGAGDLVDVILAVCLAHVHEAALLLHDAGRLVHPLRERPALDPFGVGGGHALRHLVEEVVQTLVPLAAADLLQEDGGQGVVGLGEEGGRLLGERVYWGGAAGAGGAFAGVAQAG